MDIPYANVKTRSRRDFGLLFLELFDGFEPDFFDCLDDIPIVQADGGYGKSYIADIFLAALLDGYDPMDVINGSEQNKMCLEEEPMEAVGSVLIEDGQHQGNSAGFLFSVHADIFLNRHWDEYGEGRRVDVDCAERMRKVFGRKLPNAKGGLIFGSGTRWTRSVLGEPVTWMSIIIDHRGPRWQDTNIDLAIHSDKLLSSKRFMNAFRTLEEKWAPVKEVSAPQYDFSR